MNESLSLSSEPPDYFEFSNEACHSGHMSHAEDIISCGKLMPYKVKQPPPFHYDRRYCDSLPHVDPSRSNTRLTRSSRSLDSKKLRRNSSIIMKSEASDVYRTPFSKRSIKPIRWYAFMFGPRKFPPEMDLRDIRSRQVRMSPAMEPAPVNRTWGHDLLRVLSCKDDQSVGVAASARLSSCQGSYSRDYHVQKYACSNR